MNDKPLVSVIIPFFNAQKFIDEAIQSVYGQTYDDWELILVDDGSTDNSTSIALRHTQQRPEQVRYLQHQGHENRGLSASRNLGIHHAKGEYIAFLDADDVWLPRKLERQVGILDSQPEAAMVYGSAKRWYGWTGNPRDTERDGKMVVEAHGFQPNTLIHPPTLLVLLMRGTEVVCPCTVMVRRSGLARVGGFEEVRPRSSYEDQVFYAKVFLNMPVFVADECWAKYRLHPDSMCAVAEKTGQSALDRLAFVNWLENYLSEQGVSSTAVWQAFRIMRWSCDHPILYRLYTGLAWKFPMPNILVRQAGRFVRRQ